LPTRYLFGAAQTIFTITGGLVLIRSFLCYCDTAIDALANGTTIVGTVNGVAISAPAIATTGSIAGDIIVFPMGAVAIVAMGNPTEPMPTVIGDTAHYSSVIAGPVNGLIQVTFGVADMAAAELCSFRCIYEKIDPEALIA